MSDINYFTEVEMVTFLLGFAVAWLLHLLVFHMQKDGEQGTIEYLQGLAAIRKKWGKGCEEFQAGYSQCIEDLRGLYSNGHSNEEE